ncbi:hypothetical protein [uncultured Microbulbifer sp.]|uniref:hypothetical protein n=1 Tax=uncultured Microbulbifer sp. TaxID=348147 RepID=UPI0026310481|nr:hypothetical protein [uncultured Microbulbifer sp.]
MTIKRDIERNRRKALQRHCRPKAMKPRERGQQIEIRRNREPQHVQVKSLGKTISIPVPESAAQPAAMELTINWGTR